MYQIVLSNQAEKDKKRLKQARLERRAKALLGVIAENPLKNPPRYEKVVG